MFFSPTKKRKTTGDRYTISYLRKQGFTTRDIAKEINRDKSTVYLEIKRNSCNDGRYRSFKTISRTKGRISRSRRNSQFTHDDYKVVNKYLRKKLSPKHISETLYIKGVLSISHEMIYKRVWRDRCYGGNLYTHYLPKGKSMSGITQEKCNKIAYELNTRPREQLAFKTPQEVFENG